MRNSSPIENTGVVCRRSDGAFLGTCFIFRNPDTMLTADHVVAGYERDELAVALPASRARSSIFSVLNVQSHPTGDLAVLTICPPDERDITWAIDQMFNDYSYGLDVMAYGYPVQTVKDVVEPTPRLFQGYVQRFFSHSSHLGYKYLAAELNFSCPGGLSGSLLINQKHHGRLYGIVTENLRTSTELESILEVTDDGREYKESYHNIINFGVAMWLPAVSDWINTVVPPLTQEEITRRSENQHKWNIEERGEK